ncbi:MAG: hypothetical protein ABT20_15135 [Rubrivivax sp. SCN 70-15]|nr:MAG: hypothetical protein ABT20_15135 [Rubrivivax sp. SCN 70-15]
MHHAAARRQLGATLIESSIVLAIAAVALGLAAPSFQQTHELRRLEGAAAQLETDLQYTRSLAVARNETLRVAFVGTACYVVHSGGPADCTCADDGSAQCTGSPAVHRVVRLGRIGISSNSRSIAFDAVKGTVTPTATVRLAAADGREIRQIVNLMGRIRSCSPAPALPGYRAC